MSGIVRVVFPPGLDGNGGALTLRLSDVLTIDDLKSRVLQIVLRKRISSQKVVNLDPANFCIVYMDGEGISQAEEGTNLSWFLQTCERSTTTWTVFLLFANEREHLNQEYCRLLATSFLPNSAQTYSLPLHQGYLKKRSRQGRFGSHQWQKRYWQLTPTALLYWHSCKSAVVYTTQRNSGGRVPPEVAPIMFRLEAVESVHIDQREALDDNKTPKASLSASNNNRPLVIRFKHEPLASVFTSPAKDRRSSTWRSIRSPKKQAERREASGVPGDHATSTLYLQAGSVRNRQAWLTALTEALAIRRHDNEGASTPSTPTVSSPVPALAIRRHDNEGASTPSTPTVSSPVPVALVVQENVVQENVGEVQMNESDTAVREKTSIGPQTTETTAGPQFLSLSKKSLHLTAKNRAGQHLVYEQMSEQTQKMLQLKSDMARMAYKKKQKQKQLQKQQQSPKQQSPKQHQQRFTPWAGPGGTLS